MPYETCDGCLSKFRDDIIIGIDNEYSPLFKNQYCPDCYDALTDNEKNISCDDPQPRTAEEV